MTVGLGIVAGIIILAAAFFLWSKRGRGAMPTNQASAKPVSKKKKKTTDTQAFRQWASGDIDHDKYRELLEQNEKE